jgi:hypothetical protein
MKKLKNLTDIGNLLASHPISYDELYKALVKWEEDHLTPDLIKSLYISKLFQSLKS